MCETIRFFLDIIQHFLFNNVLQKGMQETIKSKNHESKL